MIKVLLIFICTVFADCPQNEHSISSLPGQAGDLGLCQYAGYIDVSDEAKFPGQQHELFYWFFRNEDTTKPVILWMNGGPGASSMFGLFLENGPLRVAQNGDDFSVSRATKSWADDYHVIYIDEPINTGFSYGNQSLTSMQDGADEFVSFVVGFFKEYQDLSANDFYLTGESYCGKYLPLFSQKILKHNDGATNETIQLKATLIIDPFTSPTQKFDRWDVPYHLNIVDDNNMLQIETLNQRCRVMQHENLTEAFTVCNQISNYLTDIGGNLQLYDTRIFAQDQDMRETPYINYLSNNTELFEAIHVANSPKVPVWEVISHSVSVGYSSDELVDYSGVFNDLFAVNYTIAVMAGEFDAISGGATQPIWMKDSLNVDAQFWTQDRKVYYYQADGKQNVGGYWIDDRAWNGSFTLMTVPKSGHFIPQDNYDVSIQVLNDIVANKSLGCYEQDGDCTVTEVMCQTMLLDNSSGICGENGQFVCNEGYIGADCTQQLVNAAESTTTNFTDVWTGYNVKYFAFANLTDDLWSIDIQTNLFTGSATPLNLYAITGLSKAPSKFNFDLMLADMKDSVTITQDSYNCGDSCIFAVESIGYDQAKNMPSEIQVEVMLTRAKPSDSVLLLN